MRESLLVGFVVLTIIGCFFLSAAGVGPQWAESPLSSIPVQSRWVCGWDRAEYSGVPYLRYDCERRP